MFEELETNHETLFPGTYASVGKAPLSGYKYVSTVTPKSEWSNGIINNDPNHAIFLIHNIGSDMFEAELILGSRIMNTDSKIPFRKTKGDYDKIVTAIEKWEIKRKDAWEKR